MFFGKDVHVFEYLYFEIKKTALLKMRQEQTDQFGPQDGRQEKAEQSTVEMGIMIDVIPRPLRHILAIGQIKHAE